MAAPFDLFTTTSYTFLELESGTGGNAVVSETAATGIFKSREGMAQTANREDAISTSTLHIRPTEAFIATVGGHQKLVGNGVRVDGQEYRIEGVSEGKDFDTGSVAFYNCTLKREAIWQSGLPLA